MIFTAQFVLEFLDQVGFEGRQFGLHRSVSG